MEKIHKIALGVLVIGIAFNIIIAPGISIIAGLGLWILLWFAQGGMADGNPYKRMAYGGGAPDFIEISQYRKNEEVELRDRGGYYTAAFVFGIGGILVLTGILWIWIFGF